MTTTISLHKFLKGANPVADHRPWPRVVVDEARWLALREQLATSDWALLGLWGDRSAAGSLSVHVALRDETEEVADGIAVVTLLCPQRRFPSLAAVRPGAMFGLRLSEADLGAALATVESRGTRGPPHPFFA